jgi:hypothetical protein
MAIFLPNGLGDYPLSDSLGYARPLQMSGNVWYVNGSGGVDAVSPAGRNAEKPLATLGQAIANAADDDIIVLAHGHSEALSSAVVVDKAVTILGASSTGGIPQAWLTRTGGAAVNLLTITAAGVQLRNLRFPPTDTADVPTARIEVTGARFRMVGCSVSMGEHDTGPALLLAAGADRAEIRNCLFEVDSVTTAPESAITSGAAITDLRIYNTTFDGGSLGFTNPYAVDLSTAAVTRIEAEGLALLRGADIRLHASSTGWVHIEDATGGARMDW